jgi:hypothetical protein
VTDAAIPQEREAITAEWLTTVLSTGGLDVEVARIEVLDQHSGTTGRVRVGLTYGAGDEGPPSVFIKLPPFDESQRGLVAATGMGRREAQFYAGPAADVPMRIPRAHHAAWGDEATEYIMVLEDLEASGCRFPKGLDPEVPDHVDQLMAGFARLHAHFWNHADFEGKLSWIEPSMRGPFGAMLIESARQQFADELGPTFDALCGLFIANHERIVDIWDEGERTLVHGDPHGGNHFLDGDTLGLYDWAVISTSPGIRDVAIYLGNSCPAELRREGQEGWIRAYHHGLVADGIGDAPSEAVLFERYRRVVLYAWVAAATTAAMGDKWQPLEVGMAGMRRATTACEDLDTLGALRDVL